MSEARPGYGHTTGSGRTSWNCHDGKIEIGIHRPSGIVLAATIDTTNFNYATEKFLVVEVGVYGTPLPRHLEALKKATCLFGALPNEAELSEIVNYNQSVEIRLALELLKREIGEINPNHDFAALDAAVDAAVNTTVEQP